MRISDWSSDVCSSDLNGSNADVGGSPLCPSPSRPQSMGAGKMQADPVCLLCSLPLAAHAARDACAAFVGHVAEGSGTQEQGFPFIRPGTRLMLECRRRENGCLTNQPLFQRGEQSTIPTEHPIPP